MTNGDITWIIPLAFCGTTILCCICSCILGCCANYADQVHAVRQVHAVHNLDDPV